MFQKKKQVKWNMSTTSLESENKGVNLKHRRTEAGDAYKQP